MERHPRPAARAVAGRPGETLDPGGAAGRSPRGARNRATSPAARDDHRRGSRRGRRAYVPGTGATANRSISAMVSSARSDVANELDPGHRRSSGSPRSRGSVIAVQRHVTSDAQSADRGTVRRVISVGTLGASRPTGTVDNASMTSPVLGVDESLVDQLSARLGFAEPLIELSVGGSPGLVAFNEAALPAAPTTSHSCVQRPMYPLLWHDPASAARCQEYDSRSPSV